LETQVGAPFGKTKTSGTPFWGKKASRRGAPFCQKKKVYTFLKKTKQVGTPYLGK